MTKKIEMTRFGPPPLCRVIFFIAGGIGFATFQQAARNSDSLENLPFYLGLLLLTFAIGWIGQAFSRSAQQRQQRQRDERAQFILGELEQGRMSMFSLYLRGFTTTGKMHEFVTVRSFELSRGDTELILDLEAILAEAVEPVAPLIALGKPGEQIGAGRIESQNDQWRRVLKLLVSHAMYIFVIPTDSPGTKYEIEHILEEGMIENCFFIMPPEHKKFNWSEQWNQVAAELQKIGVKLPEYQIDGKIFTFGGNGTEELSRSFGTNRTVKSICNNIKEILRGVGDTEIEKTPESIKYCPNCEEPYRLSDYRSDTAIIFCSSCKKELPTLHDQVSG